MGPVLLNTSGVVRTLLYLQLVVQIQNHLFTGDSSVSILRKPDQILSFIKHALESSSGQNEKQAGRRRQERKGLGLEDLRIVEDDQDQQDSAEEDSDDEDGETATGGGDDDMTSTAVNLLLSVLEGVLSLLHIIPIFLMVHVHSES